MPKEYTRAEGIYRISDLLNEGWEVVWFRSDERMRENGAQIPDLRTYIDWLREREALDGHPGHRGPQVLALMVAEAEEAPDPE